MATRGALYRALICAKDNLEQQRMGRRLKLCEGMCCIESAACVFVCEDLAPRTLPQEGAVAGGHGRRAGMR